MYSPGPHVAEVFARGALQRGRIARERAHLAAHARVLTLEVAVLLLDAPHLAVELEPAAQPFGIERGRAEQRHERDAVGDREVPSDEREDGWARHSPTVAARSIE